MRTWKPSVPANPSRNPARCVRQEDRRQVSDHVSHGSGCATTRSLSSARSIVLLLVLLGVFAPLICKLLGIGPDSPPNGGTASTYIEFGYPKVGPPFYRVHLGPPARPGAEHGLRQPRPAALRPAHLARSSPLGDVLHHGHRRRRSAWWPASRAGSVDRIITFIIDIFLSFPFILGALALAPIITGRFADQPDKLEVGPVLRADRRAGHLRLDEPGPADPRPGAVAARARVRPGRAGASACPTRRILFKELLPNMVAPIVVSISLTCPAFVAAEAGLSFLGIGLTGYAVARADHPARRRPTYDTYPLYLWAPVVDRDGARGGAQPPRRLGSRRLRPQDSSLTTSATRRTTNQGKGGLRHAVEETDHCRLHCRVCSHSPLVAARATTAALGERQHVSRRSGSAGSGKDPNREAPAPEIEGAQKGGTVKVISVAGLNTMDPTEAYYTNTGLDPEQPGHPVADAVRLRRGNRRHGPGPGPGHRPRYAERRLHRVDVHDPRGREVRERPGGHRRRHRLRHQAVLRPQTFPEGAAYSNDYFLDGDKYKGPYTGRRRLQGLSTVDGNKLTIKMAKPFPDMPYWGAFPAMGPIPDGQGQRPGQVRACTRGRPVRTSSTSTRRRSRSRWSRTPTGTRTPTRAVTSTPTGTT